VRYADDMLLGFTGPKNEAEEIKRQIAAFLHNELKLELSDEKTLITHATTEKAHFLGYEIHTLQADDKHDHRGQRCINGAIGLRVPYKVIQSKSVKYKRRGKPIHLMQRVNDTAYSIVAQYQAEYVGIVQYYRLAYNLHQLSKLKRMMEVSLAKTLAKKYKTTCSRIYKRFGTTLKIKEGTYKVLQVQLDREPGKSPLVAHFGGVPLQWNKWVAIYDTVEPIWSKRSEIVERLLAQECELCGAKENIEVHHIRKLADVNLKGHADRPEWMKIMAARKRKTLIVCQKCHHDIQYGRYDGLAISGHGRAA
jgi:hypothetical protein